MSSLKAEAHGAFIIRPYMFVTPLTSHVDMCPCLATALVVSVHQSTNAVSRLAVALKLPEVKVAPVVMEVVKGLVKEAVMEVVKGVVKVVVAVTKGVLADLGSVAAADGARGWVHIGGGGDGGGFDPQTGLPPICVDTTS